jgi:hypothetical protein
LSRGWRITTPAGPREAAKSSPLTCPIQSAPSDRANAKQIVVLLLLSAGAIFVHGYHPFVEDAEIYVPGIKKLLNPALYPVNQGFFASHAHLTLFPNLIAMSVRITHLPFEWILAAWHFACVFFLLFGCWKLGMLCFANTRAAWGSAALVASLLTIPVAGTALYIMDQYVNTRSCSTATAVWIVLGALRRKYVQLAALVIFTALIHPLMSGFWLVFATLLLWERSPGSRSVTRPACALLLPLSFFPPVTDAYRRVLDSHSYFFLLRWQWYEWLGALAPLIIFHFFQRIARRRGLISLAALSSAATTFGLIFFAAGLVITIPQPLMRFVELQPMRSLLLIYILLFVVSGGLIAEFLLQGKTWRWIALFLPICAGMFYAQRQLFPATPHLEWPDADSSNPKSAHLAPSNRTSSNPESSNRWVQAFRWVRDNTPVEAYFALDPEHMRLEGEDQHGFRAIAERSRLADAVKDSGSVTMFPGLAETWLDQTRAERGWRNFSGGDFSRLRQQYGVTWVVVQQPGIAGLQCPYKNPAVLVCRIPEARAQ